MSGEVSGGPAGVEGAEVRVEISDELPLPSERWLGAAGGPRQEGGGLTSVARGRLAEEAAAEFLVRQGFEVLDRNYRTPLGELDLVCRAGGRTVVVEVKARSSLTHGSGIESIGRLKQRRLRGAAAWWMAEKGWAPGGIRFDVVTVHLGPGGSLRALYHLPDVLESGR